MHDDTNLDELAHYDERNLPTDEQPVEETPPPTAVYGDPARGYGAVYGPDDEHAPAPTEARAPGFRCDDPTSLTDRDVLAE